MIVTFKEKYLQMKDNGLSDREIASLMGMGKDKLLRVKKANGVTYHTRTTRNKTGLTQRQINIALSHGLTSKLAIRRVREYGWSITDAINTPNRGKIKVDVDEKERQHQYYLNRKRKVWRGL